MKNILLFLIFFTLIDCSTKESTCELTDSYGCGDIHSDGKDFMIETKKTFLEKMPKWKIGEPLPLPIDSAPIRTEKLFCKYTSDTSKWFIGSIELGRLPENEDLWFYQVHYYRKDEGPETNRIQYMHIPAFFDSVPLSVVPIQYK